MTRAAAHIAVSAACLVTHNAVMIGADFAGVSLAAAMLASFCVVVVLGYSLHSLITFREQLSWHGLQRYTAAMSANLVMAFALTFLLRDAFALPMIIAAPAASILMIAVNFLLSRWAIVVPAKSVE